MAQLKATEIFGDLNMHSHNITNVQNVDAVTFNASSDARLKKDIVKINNIDWSKIINQINIYKYDWKNESLNLPDTHNVGTIAQELRTILPDEFKHFIVSGNEDIGYLSINDSKLIYFLIGAFQQQLELNEKLQSDIQKLYSEIEQLKGK